MAQETIAVAPDVFVVMGNDYPQAVFTTEARAEAYCVEMRKADALESKQTGQRRMVYWRVYAFPLRGDQ